MSIVTTLLKVATLVWFEYWVGNNPIDLLVVGISEMSNYSHSTRISFRLCCCICAAATVLCVSGQRSWRLQFRGEKNQTELHWRKVACCKN